MGTEKALEEIKKSGGFKITNQAEKDLALSILRFPEQLDLTVSDLKLNMLTD